MKKELPSQYFKPKTAKIDMLAKFVGYDIANRLAVKFFGACSGFSPEKMFKNFLDKYPNAKPVNPDNLVREIFKIFYGQQSANDIVPDSSTPFAVSYGTYRKGMTSLLFFNFFKQNYGIRDPILFRISIMCGQTLYWTTQFLSPADQVEFIENLGSDLAKENLPENGTFQLEAFHPRIKTPSRQIRFFAFLQNRKKGIISGVHSMDVPHRAHLNHGKLCFRAFVPKGAKAFYNNVIDPYQPLVESSQKELFSKGITAKPARGVMGYCVMTDQEGVPFSVWHDNCSDHSVSAWDGFDPKIGKPRPCRTGFYVPDMKKNAPLVHVSSHEIGFRVDSVKIGAFSCDGSLLSEKNHSLQGDYSGFDLGEIFRSEELSGPVYFIVDFNRKIEEFEKQPTCYLHLHYRAGSKIADNVHTHTSSTSRYAPGAGPKSYRCLKMAPFLKGYKNLYSIVTVGANAPDADLNVKLRIYTDTGSEHTVNKFPLQNPDGVVVLTGEELLQFVGEKNIRKSAVIWFEHFSINLNGSWFLIDPSSGDIAIDHFTGA